MLGQTQSNLRSKILYLNRDTIQLDSLIILPQTLCVYHQNKLLDTSYYKLAIAKGLFIPSKQLKLFTDSIAIKYRVYDYNILKPASHRDLSQISLSPEKASRKFAIRAPKKASTLFSGGQLEKQGNYTRGIAYGNNQDVVVNSNLNLQLSGKLSEDIRILAAISDNNIPIQPDGNTQNIQDFDRIYIQLYNDTKELTLGDYELKSPRGKFLKFDKKVQGGKFSGLFAKDNANKTEFRSTISASIAKGKFNRLTIPGLEGIQGPYRLTGANNERYIVVLAASEKVYLDGKLLSRGENNDYVINYNSSELSFTTKQPITSNTRIVIEFEYAEENYSRYLLFAANELKSKNGKFWFNFFHEQDSKNQPIDQSLSDENKQLLSDIGDQLEMAQVPNIETVEYSNDFVLYKKTNRLIDGIDYEVYVYSTDADRAIYRANFSFVGTNNGNYQQLNSTVNGRVYQWVDPVDGIPQGEYEPIIQLIAPEKKQLFTLGGERELGKNLHATVELAISNKDVNTFSSLDDNDNKGTAIDFSLEKKFDFADTGKTFTSLFAFRHINKHFSEIEPFRSTEYERDWNLQEVFTKSNESYYDVSNTFANQNWGSASYTYSILTKESDYKGDKHALALHFKKQKLAIDFDGNSLSTDQNELNSKFYRHQLNTSYLTKFAKIGVQTENENNKWKNKADSKLLQNSFSFYSYKFYITNRDSSLTNFQAYYRKRKDYLAGETKLSEQSESEDIGASIWLKKKAKNQLKIETIYRKLSILDANLSADKPENTFLAKLEHRSKIKKGLLQTSTYYELGSGLESEKEFSYIEVNQGQGIYRWTDYNENEVKELNEFEIASFRDEANYIRIGSNTNNYQKVYTSEFRQSFNLRLRQLKSKKKFVSFFKRFSNRFAYRLAKKSLSNNFKLYANPLNAYTSNENLITINSSFQNTFSYKKPKSKTNWDIIYLSSNAKQLLTQGFERRKFTQNGIRFQWRMTKASQLSNRVDFSKKKLNSESFTDKNYAIDEIKNELETKFQISLQFQFGINYSFNKKENKLASEKSSTHNIGGECNYGIAKSTKLMATVNFLHIDYKADPNSSISYEMLEGFLPGKNTTWSLSYNQQLSKLFQLSVSYNGRSSESGKIIHVGNVELRAYF